MTGYLCQPRDAPDLAVKMSQMLSLSAEQRTVMGLCGRANMVAQFDEQTVIKKYLAAIEEILAKRRVRPSGLFSKTTLNTLILL